MRDMHDGSFSPDCVDCLKYEKSQLEAGLREQKAVTMEVHAELNEVHVKLETELKEAQERNRIDNHKVDMLLGQLDFAVKERDNLRAQLETSHQYRRELADSNTFMKNQAKALNSENARRRNENKGLQVQLEKARAEVESLRWEASVRTTPTMNRVHALEEEKARLRSTLDLAQEAARDRISFLEEGSERMRALLDDAREEIQQRNEEIAELKRARLYSIPTTYIVGADPSDPVWSRMKLLEEENARLEADNAKLEALDEQTSISLEHVRQDLFSAQAKLMAIGNAVK